MWFPHAGKAWKQAAWPRANPNSGQSKHSTGKCYFLTLPCYCTVSSSILLSTEIYTQLLTLLPSPHPFPPLTRFNQPRAVELKRTTCVTLPCVTWAFTQEDTFIKLLNAHGGLENHKTRMLCKASEVTSSHLHIFCLTCFFSMKLNIICIVKLLLVYY